MLKGRLLMLLLDVELLLVALMLELELVQVEPGLVVATLHQPASVEHVGEHLAGVLVIKLGLRYVLVLCQEQHGGSARLVPSRGRRQSEVLD